MIHRFGGRIWPALGVCLAAMAALISAPGASAPGSGPARPAGLACFAPGTSPERIAEVERSIFGLGDRFQIENRWSSAPSFQGLDLTYSFPPDGINLPPQFSFDTGGSNVLHARMNMLFNGDTALWKEQFRLAFEEWSHITGNTYTEVSDDGASWPTSGGNQNRGDIRIVMRNIDGQLGVLGFNLFPDQGDMLLDASESWGGQANSFRFLRNVVMHEHGHGLGLAHVCPTNQTKLMEPAFNANIDKPRLDDIRGGQDRYGDRFEPNNNVDDAIFLPGLAPEVNLVVDTLSLHRWFDRDVFLLPSDGETPVSVTATPFGETYLDGPQNSDGTCTPGDPVDALMQQDLIVEILAPDGQTVVASSDSGGFGDAESISGAALSPAGVYYIRVSANQNAPDSSVQMYSLQVDLSGPGPDADLTGDGCVDAFDLGELLGSWGPGSPAADLNGDGTVDAFDLGELLGNWGAGC